MGGDDHGAKSSTIAAQTDFIFKAVSMPVLAPATVQDYIDLGLHGFALSRFSGLWVGMKAVTDTIEASGIVDVSADRVRIGCRKASRCRRAGLNLRWPEEPFLKLEERLAVYKLPAALAYARANRLDANVFGRPDGEPSRLGIVTTGKTWLDVMQALVDLGIDDATARRIGLKVYKVAMPWPLEPQGIRRIRAGCRELLVIEEKRSLIEAQLKEALYALPERPPIVGKSDERAAPLLPEWGELSPAACARVIAARLLDAGATGRGARRALPDEVVRRIGAAAVAARCQGAGFGLKKVTTLDRIPYFCSGCPHNTSTRVPEGSRALAGIGCHYMAQWMDRSTATFTQMGGEGMTWVGQAPFTETGHVFQNLGDGTWFHSGSLAIRHAVATNTPITYKILFNDAVAMTGGQSHDGQVTPQMITRQVRAEGVQRVVVVTDEPQKYPAGLLRAGHRGLPSRQSRRRAAGPARVRRRVRPGVRPDLRGREAPAPQAWRVRRIRTSAPFINERCARAAATAASSPTASRSSRWKPSSAASGSSTSPPATRTIPASTGSARASSASSAASCAAPAALRRRRRRGEPGRGRRPVCACRRSALLPSPSPAASLPLSPVSPAAMLSAPDLPAIEGSYALLITGIGGTGVVTIGQILGMAAHLEGKGVTVLDMAGLAQKNGAVMSFVRFAEPASRSMRRASAPLPRMPSSAATSSSPRARTRSVAWSATARGWSPTWQARRRRTSPATPTCSFPCRRCPPRSSAAVGKDNADFVDATRLATALMGDSIATNLFMLGYAWQKGMIPLSAAAIERAIELNQVSIQSNKTSFAWGRRAAADPDAVAQAAAPASPVRIVTMTRKKPDDLQEIIATREAFLTRLPEQALCGPVHARWWPGCGRPSRRGSARDRPGSRRRLPAISSS